MQAIAGVWLTRSQLLSGGTAGERCRAMLRGFGASPTPQIEQECNGALALGSARYARLAPSKEAPLRNDAVAKQPATPRLLVADVRLDNREDLADLLSLDRTVRDTLPDEDLLALAWERWGEQCVTHLLGGFAFAVWDAQQRRLFLARDHAGEKPLFFAHLPGSFAFASMPKGLQELAEVGARLNQPRMARFLAVVPPLGTETFFERIERVPPGCSLSVDAQGIKLQRYWHPADASKIRYGRDEDYIAEFHHRFGAAVASRVRTSAGVASELSGGLDSASVTAIAAQCLARQGHRLTAYTAVPLPGYDGRAPRGRFGDEREAAAQVAALYPNIDHVCVSTAGQDMVTNVLRASALADEPVFNPTNQMWVHAILDDARGRGLDVLLQGVTGNATISFGGLPALGDMFRAVRWFALFRRVQRLRARGYTSWRGAASWATAGLMPLWLLQALRPELHRHVLSHSVLRPERAEEFGVKEAAFAEFHGGSGGTEAFRRKFYEYYDPGLANGAAACGWGIENRDPTQDKRVFEFCYAIPPEQFLKDDQTRSLVRRAMQGHLPASTLTRTTRGLQAADWYLVMGAQRARMEAAMARIEQSPLAQHMLDLPRLRNLLNTWPDAGYDQAAVANVYHLALSRGLAAGLFLVQHDPQSSGEPFA